MAADDTDDSESAGCQQYGCGCAGVGAALVVIAIAVSLPSASSFSTLEVFFVPVFLLIPGAILGFVARKFVPETDIRDWLGVAGKYMLWFAGICLLSAIGLTLRPGGFSYYEEIPSEGGLVGPITIEKQDMRLGVEVDQYIEEGAGRRYQRWSFVTIELLDNNKEYLSSFGGEFWHYAGYDDGYWEQDDTEYEATLEVPSSGTYYLQLQTEANVDMSELSSIGLQLEEQVWWGNPAPLQMAGYVAFFLGVILVILPTDGPVSLGFTDLSGQLKEGTEFDYRGHTWTVRGHAYYDYGEWLAEEWTVQSSDVSVKRPRYLEREYEAGSDWEAWFWSTPIDMDTLRCTDAQESEVPVADVMTAEDDVPDQIQYEDADFRLDDSGTTQRDGRSIRYHTYKERWESGSRSITIEGDPSDECSAVVTEEISSSQIAVKTEERAAEPEWEAGGGDLGGEF